MSLEIMSLADLLEMADEDEVLSILKTFETLPNHQTGDTHDVQAFLIENSIQFQKMSLSRTYLIFSSYQQKNILVGYFSIANKHLVVNKKVFNDLSKNYQKRFNNVGYRYTGEESNHNKNDLIIPSFLIGQLGKNYSEEAKNSKALNGYNIMSLAEEKIKEVASIIGGKYAWLECQPHENLLNFYESCGYLRVPGYQDDEDELCILVKKVV